MRTPPLVEALPVIDTVLPSFIVIGLAYVLQRYKRMEIRALIETALYLASPCLIFSSLSSKSYSLAELFPVVISAVFVVLGSLAVSRAVFLTLGVSDIDARTLPVVLINSGNLGIPISLFAFGEEALGVIVMFFVTSAMFTYTLGILLAARSSGSSNRPWLEVFKLPLLYAAILGVLVSVLEIDLPIIVSRPVGILGQAAIPLFLISLGMSLAEIDPRRQFAPALLSAVMRISLGILFGVASAFVLGLTGVERGVVILQSSMPPAVASFMLSRKYGCNPGLVSATVFTGTLISIFTISLVLNFAI